MEKDQSLRNNTSSTYSLNGVMEYLNDQIQLLTDKEMGWNEERQQLENRIAQLERDLSQQKALNCELVKKMKHRRTSSQDKTIIFNQTNISSYFPPIVMMHRSTWTSKKNLRSHLDSVRALAWHNDYLVSSGEDCLMKFWRDGELVSTVREHLGPVFAMSKHLDSLYTAGSEGLVRQWDLSDIKKGNVSCTLEAELHSEVIWELNHHKSLPLMLTSGADGLIQLVRTDVQLALQHRFLRKLTNGEQLYTPTSLDWIGNDRFVTSYVELADIVLFDIPTQKIVMSYPFKFEEKHRQANKILYSEYKHLIMSAHEDKTIRFMDPSSGKQQIDSDKIIKSLVAHSDAVTGLTFHEKSYEFGSSSHDGSVRVWDMRNFRCLNDVPIPCKKYDEAANTLLQHPTDMVIAVGGADGIIRMLFESE